MKLILSLNAHEDVADILSFTDLKWGSKQRVAYKKKLRDAFNHLTKNPKIGQRVYDHYVYIIGSHRIFYSLKDNQIIILRILHQRMDTQGHL